MKRRLLMLALVGATLAIAGCQDSAPLSPAPEPGNVSPALAGAPGIPVKFYSDVGPGQAENPECLRDISAGITLIHECEIRARLPRRGDGDIGNPLPDAMVWIVTGKQDSEGNGRGVGLFHMYNATWYSGSRELTGDFEGNAVIEWTEGLGEGILHARGTGGDFWGMQMWGDFSEQEDPTGTGNFVVTVTGTIR